MHFHESWIFADFIFFERTQRENSFEKTAMFAVSIWYYTYIISIVLEKLLRKIFSENITHSAVYLRFLWGVKYAPINSNLV